MSNMISRRPVSRHVVPTSLKVMAANEIRRRVFAGELLPGSKVDQEALATELGISKLPIREALISLEAEGVIQNIARRGAFVANLSREDIEDHYRIFGLVAGVAAERAALNLTEDDIAGLRAIAEQMEANPSSDGQDELNSEFHRRINHAARSRRLLSVLGVLVNALPPGFYEFHKEWPEKAHADHREILEALANKRGEEARLAVERHFAAGGELAVALLETRGFWADGGS